MPARQSVTSSIEGLSKTPHRRSLVLFARREDFRRDAHAGRDVCDSHGAVVQALARRVDHEVCGCALHARILPALARLRDNTSPVRPGA